jgi:hypothetical protein
MKPQKFTDITPEDIAEWKEKHLQLREVEVFLSDDDLADDSATAKFVICQPTRSVMNACAKYSTEKDFARATRLMINSCVLGGDMQHISEDNKDTRVESKIMEELYKLVEVKKANVKKL